MSELDGGYAIYPSGFAAFVEGTPGSSSAENDPAVAALYVGMIDGQLDVKHTDTFMAVLEVAKRLLGKGHRWATTQRYNPNITKQQADFIEDTLNYIQTGRRGYYPQTWLSLIDEPNKAPLKTIVLGGGVVHRQIVVPEALTKGNPASLIARWLSHDGGVSDMICALNIMYGGVPYVRGGTAPTL